MRRRSRTSRSLVFAATLALVGLGGVAVFTRADAGNLASQETRAAARDEGATRNLAAQTARPADRAGSVRRIANRAELVRALNDTRGGFTLELAPGDYGVVMVETSAANQNRRGAPRFDRAVTIRSADPCNPARFRSLVLRGVSNVVLEGLHFENPDFFRRPREELLLANGRMRNLDLLRTDAGSDITIRGNSFAGPTIAIAGGHELDGYGYGFGWKGLHLRGARFTNNRLTNLYKAISVGRSAGLEIAANEMSDYRSDAVFLNNVEDVTIVENRMFRPRPRMLLHGQGDHPDFIQILHADGARIENNYMDIGVAANASQGIFGGPARNFVIRNNVIATRSVNGIFFGSLAESEIANNLVVNAALPAHEMRTRELFNHEPQLRINRNYRNVTIANNVASRFSNNFDRMASGGQLAATGNVMVQNVNPRGANYYHYNAGGGRSSSATDATILVTASAGLTRIGNVSLGALGNGAGPDPSKFGFLLGDSGGSAGRCGG